MTHLKVCGIQTAADLMAVDAARVDFAGVWWHLAEGARNVPTSGLSAVLAPRLQHARVVLVTVGRSAEALAQLLTAHRIQAVQLSGFELPGFVDDLHARVPDVRLFKTLHVHDAFCLQARWIDAYRSAGVQDFIVDRFVSRTAIGSTGLPVPEAAVTSLLDRLSGCRVWLAGGIDPARMREGLDARLSGVDVDSGARLEGRLDGARLRALVAAVRRNQPQPEAA